MKIEKYKQVLISSAKQNLINSITFYETKGKYRKMSDDSFGDLSKWFTNEFEKIMLNLANTDEEVFYEVYRSRKIHEPFYEWPKIRMMACSSASNLRTLKVSELTEYEKKEARKLIEHLVNDYLVNLKRSLV